MPGDLRRFTDPLDIRPASKGIPRPDYAKDPDYENGVRAARKQEARDMTRSVAWIRGYDSVKYPIE